MILKRRHVDLALASGLAAASLAVGIGVLARGHPHEDAYILFKYANDVARGDGIAFYPGGPHAEGATDFLWMIALAGMKVAGIDVAVAAALLNATAFFVTVSLFLRASAPLGRATRAPLLVVTALLLVAPSTIAGYLGFSAPLFSALALLLYALACTGAAPRLPWVPLVAILLALVRPDGVVLGGGFVVLAFLRVRRTNRRRYLGSVGVATLVGISYFVWRWRYFGELLPLPLYVKSHYGSPPPSLMETWDWVLASVVPVALFLAAVRLLVGRIAAPAGGHLRWLALGLLPYAAHVGSLMVGAPSQNVAHRFQAPASLALLFFAVHVAGAGERRERLGVARSLALSLAACVPFYPHAVSAWRNVGDALRPHYIEAFAYALAGITTRDTRLATTEAGRLAYWSEARVLDLVGLNSVETANVPPTAALLADFAPDIVMMHHASTMEEARFPASGGALLLPLPFPLAQYLNPASRWLLTDRPLPYRELHVDNVLAAPVTTVAYLDAHASEYDAFVARFESRFFHYHVYAIRRGYAGHDAVLAALARSENAPGAASYLDLVRRARDAAP